MRTVTEQVVKDSVKNMNDRKIKFMVKGKRNNHTIFVGKKAVMSNKSFVTVKKDKSHNQANALIAQVANQMRQYMFDHGIDEPAISQRHPTIKKNKDTWSKLKNGSIFYYIDVSHCYWRIAYLRCYINKQLYEKANNNPDLKIHRNMALSCTIAPNRAWYYDEGELLVQIDEDRSILARMYKNIRFTAYNTMGDIKDTIEKTHKDHCYGYNTDGIMVPKRGVDFVCRCLESVNLTYTVEKCRKINAREYLLISEDKLKRY